MGAAGILHLLEYVLLGPDDAVFGVALVLAIFECALFIFAYYVAGWLIGSGFYRYEGGGLLFIPLAVALVFAIELLWEADSAERLQLNFLSEPYTPYLWTILLLAVALWVIRANTSQVRIRLK